MYNYDLTRQPKSKLTLLAAEARRWTLFAVDATTRMEHKQNIVLHIYFNVFEFREHYVWYYL